jgi:hypothetical protein
LCDFFANAVLLSTFLISAAEIAGEITTIAGDLDVFTSFGG